jgi:uncharacterized membrane protein YGL010W
MPESFVDNYKAKHQHPVNKLTLVFFSWRWALGLFIIGWILQFVGHAVEGNRPAFFKNPMYLIVGPWWLIRRAFAAVGLTKISPSK